VTATTRSRRRAGRGTRQTAEPTPGRTRAEDRPRSTGWRIVAGKELADHVGSARFYVLAIVLAIAGVAAIYSTSLVIRGAASGATGFHGVFLALFTGAANPVPAFVTLVGFLAPLLGIAFGFDAINGERADRTLPRLLSQPIYRDDVINGKFLAGLVAIAIVLLAVVGLIAGVGLIRIGVAPTGEDVVRLLLWVALTVIYIGFWLAFATFCSVALRRAASSALVAIALWIGLTLFGTLLATLVANVMSPVGGAVVEQVANLRLRETLELLSPNTLYLQATQAILDPRITGFGVDSALASQAQGALPTTILSLGQSLLVVWPQVVALVALTVASFGLAYVTFLRQEVRA
jgi:ABC-2 type transport system permease protein